MSESDHGDIYVFTGRTHQDIPTSSHHTTHRHLPSQASVSIPLLYDAIACALSPPLKAPSSLSRPLKPNRGSRQGSSKMVKKCKYQTCDHELQSSPLHNEPSARRQDSNNGWVEHPLKKIFKTTSCQEEVFLAHQRGHPSPSPLKPQHRFEGNNMDNSSSTGTGFHRPRRQGREEDR